MQINHPGLRFKARIRAELVTQRVLTLGFVWIIWDWKVALLTSVVWFVATALMAGGLYKSDLEDFMEHLKDCEDCKKEGEHGDS